MSMHFPRTTALLRSRYDSMRHRLRFVARLHAKRQCIAKIKKAFPDLHISAARTKLLHRSRQSLVLMVNDELIFKFPYQESMRAASAIAKERFITDRLQQAPVDIPHYTYVDAVNNFGGYVMLPDTYCVLDRMSTSERQHITVQIADFLSYLHRQPVESYASELESEVFFSHWLIDEWRGKIAQNIFPLLHAEEEAWFRKCIDRYKFIAGRHPRCLLHYDLNPENILYNPRERKIGVIDFGSACIGDPALDFAPLWALGETFVDKVMRRYEGPCAVDEHFVERSKIAHAILPLNLIDSWQRRHLPPTFLDALVLNRKTMSHPQQVK